MNDAEKRVSQLLREAADTHHKVYRIVDGDDDDWASWYSEWLTTLSELPELLNNRPVRSEVTYLLVKLNKEFAAERPSEPWEDHYARALVAHFAR